MKWLASAAAVVLCFTAYGGELYNLIPDDAPVVVVAGNFDEYGVGALRRFLDSCVPAAMPPGLDSAQAPVLADLVALRGALDGVALEEGGYAAAPVGIAVLIGADARPMAIYFESVDQEQWRAANASYIKQSGRMSELARDGGHMFFQFKGEYLVMARTTEEMLAYESRVGAGLRQSRREGLDATLSAHSVAVEVSSLTLNRVWTNASKTAGQAVGEAISKRLREYTTLTNTIPLPDSFFGAIVSDCLANCDELLMGADVGDDRITFSGRVVTKEGSRFAQIFAEQAGGAEGAAALVPPGSVAGLALSFDGDVFWNYARSTVGAYVGGALKDQASVGGSMALAQRVFDEYRDYVGFKKAALALIPVEEGAYPALTVVAETADGKTAIKVLSGAISSLYADPLLVTFGRQSGIYFDKPLLEQKDPSSATVRIPYKMSAGDPIRASRVRQLAGPQFLWKVATMQKLGSEIVVACAAANNSPIDSVAGSPATGIQPLLGDLEDGEKMIAVGFMNLPSFVATRARVAAKLAGQGAGGIHASASAPVCSLRAFARKDQLEFECTIPAGQLKSAFAVGGVAPPPPAETEETVETTGKDGEEPQRGGRRGTRPRGKFGADQ